MSMVAAAIATGVRRVRAQPATASAIAATGRVIDKLGKPILGATVTIEGTSVHATTDKLGRFRIAAPVDAELTVEKTGFDLQLAVVTGPKVDDVVLLGSADLAETIEVHGDPPAPAPGAAALDREELQRVPGTGGDVVRTLTVMPGVVNSQLPTGYQGVAIRGSAPQDSQILVDDFAIPILFHNLAFRAIIPEEAIQSLEYIPGGFDVSHGHATAGLVELTTRPGDDKRSEEAELSLLDGGLLAQGAIDKNTHYEIGFRRSVIDLVLPDLIPSSVNLSLTTVPSYWDGQFRIDHTFGPHWKLTLSDIGTYDILQIYTSKDTSSASTRYYNRTAFDRLTAAARYHDGPWTATLELSAILPQFVLELGEDQHMTTLQPSIAPRAEVTRTIDHAIGLSNIEVRAGAEGQIQRSDLDVAMPADMGIEGQGNVAYDASDTSLHYKGSFWQPDFGQWFQVGANLDARVRFEMGMRLDEYLRNRDVAIQPRAKLEIALTPKWTARLMAGAYSRPPEYEEESLFANLKAERSKQAVAGVEYRPAEGARIQVSGYYTDFSNLITYDQNGAIGNTGRGSSVGAELLASYHHGPWFAWLSYAYSHAVRIDYPGAAERLFSFDQPHSLNAALSWQHGHWTLGSRFELYSGLPYTPALGGIYNSDTNTYYPINAASNSARAPMHDQLDLRVDYTMRAGPLQLTYFLDVQNVYLNESVVTYFYSYDYTQKAPLSSIPIIPSLGIRGVW